MQVVLGKSSWWLGATASVLSFRDTFDEFALWCRRSTDFIPIRVTYQFEPMHQLLGANSVYPVDMAGRVVWVRNGQVKGSRHGLSRECLGFEVSNHSSVQIGNLPKAAWLRIVLFLLS